MVKAKLSLATFGVILGIAGIEHGVGEILQGSYEVGKHFFESWPDNELYKVLAGEPAFTILSEITYTTLGIIAILVSILLIICSVFFIDKKYGSLMFFILNSLMFAFGAGFAGPIIIGIPIFVFSIILRRTRVVRTRGEEQKMIIRKTFNFFYVLSILGWFMMWPGFVLISIFYSFSTGSEPIIYSVGGISIFSFFLTNIYAIIHDRTIGI